MAGLTSGQQNITVTGILDPYFPINAAGGRLGVQGNLGTAASPNPIAGITGTYVICSSNIAGKFAKQLDIMLDDGNTDSGSMRVTSSPAGTAAIPTGQPFVTTVNINNDALYTVCMGV
jgi:hypothetical protein